MKKPSFRKAVAITSLFLLVAAVGVLLGFICGLKRGENLGEYSHDRRDGSHSRATTKPDPLEWPLDLLKAIWREAPNLRVFPVDVVAYYGRFHDAFQLQESGESTNDRLSREQNNEAIAEFARRYGDVPFFNRDRRFDLTMANYAPLLRILKRVPTATEAEIDKCVEYLDRADAREKALILAVVYRSIELKYRAGRSVLEPPNRLKKRDVKRVAELKAAIEKYKTSSEIVVEKWLLDNEESLRQWQASLRANYVRLHNEDFNQTPLLTLGGSEYSKQFALNAPDYVLYSQLLIETAQDVVNARLPYLRGNLILAERRDSLDDVPPLETHVRELIDDDYAYFKTNSEQNDLTVAILQGSNSIAYAPLVPDSEPIVASGTGKIYYERYVDDLREYLLTQFFALRLGYNREQSAASDVEARNGVVYPNEVSLGEIATALLAGLDEIENPHEEFILRTSENNKNPQKKK